MCYVLLLSTDAPDDLSVANDDLVRFSRELPDLPEAGQLLHPHRWYVGSKATCSCTFRHLHSTELGFGGPVDWFPEGDDEIEATGRFIRIVRRLLEDGGRIDCIDAWDGSETSRGALTRLAVDLAGMPDEAFRFFENHHFVFVTPDS